MVKFRPLWWQLDFTLISLGEIQLAQFWQITICWEDDYYCVQKFKLSTEGEWTSFTISCFMYRFRNNQFCPLKINPVIENLDYQFYHEKNIDAHSRTNLFPEIFPAYHVASNLRIKSTQWAQWACIFLYRPEQMKNSSLHSLEYYCCFEYLNLYCSFFNFRNRHGL